MRDKIAAIIHEHETGGVDHKGAAQAIIDALPCMVLDFVWDSDVDGTFSIGGCYEILQSDPSKFCFIHRPTTPQ